MLQSQPLGRSRQKPLSNPPTKTSTAAEPRLLFPGMFYGAKWQHGILKELDYTVHHSAYMPLHRGRRITFQGWLCYSCPTSLRLLPG